MRGHPLIALATLAALAACGPLVQIGGNDKVPTALLTLRATAAPVAGPRDVTRTLSVVTPLVPGPLQTLRLPVVTQNTELAYLTGATWAEQPNRQFAHVLADTIAAKGVTVIDARQTTIGATRVLSGTLGEFGLDARDVGALKVVIRYDALLTGDGGKTLGVRRFDASAPVASNAPGEVAVALNAVANRVAGEVAEWVAR